MLSFLSSVPSFVYVGAIALSVGFVLFYILTQLDERASARDSLRQLQDYELADQRDKALLAPARDRIFGPAVSGLSKFGGRFNPPNYADSIKSMYVQAGISKENAVERFLALRVAGFILVPIWLLGMLVWNPLGLNPMLRLVLAGVVSAGLIILPTSRLKQKIEDRQTDVRRSLPDILDLLVICVEAGLGFEQGLDRVVTNIPGALSQEFARMLGEITAGSSRSDALRNFQERVDIPEIRSFVLAMIQADSYGVSIAQVLRGQADEMRIKRRQLAQEKAQKAPVKMLIPMVFCIFPALFVVILGPAFLNILSSGI